MKVKEEIMLTVGRLAKGSQSRSFKAGSLVLLAVLLFAAAAPVYSLPD